MLSKTLFKTQPVVEGFSWGGDDSGHSCTMQHWSKWAQTGRSLRSAPMIAMRDKPAIAVRVVSDCFSNTATAAKNTIVGLQRLSEEASQKDCLRKLTFK